jgi:peptidoglycan hydrolase-like protein with peptidoglycan-binding domain
MEDQIMNKIIFPLKRRMKRSVVGDLQDTLQLLLDRGVLLANDEAARRELTEALRTERAEQTYGAITAKLVGRFQEERRLQASGEVNEPTADALNRLVDELSGQGGKQPEFVVKGAVRNPDRSPVSRIYVKAFDRRLRAEAPLGKAVTDSAGMYEIRYRAAQLMPPGKSAADLIVRAYTADNDEVAHSDLICHAPGQATVDVVIGNVPLRGPSEYDALVARVRPYLGEATLADLEREDVTFLACSAEVDRVQLATLIVANRLARQTSLPDWLFYSLGRRGVVLQLPALLGHSFKNLRELIERAIEANLIATLADIAELDRCMNCLKSVLLKTAFEAPADPGRLSVGELLGTSLVGRELQEAFLSRYLAREGSLKDFWRTLEEDDSFDPEAREDLRFTLHLGMLTQYHAPLMLQLKSLRQRGEFKSLRDLAGFDRKRWRQLLEVGERSGDIFLPPDIPGKTPEERLNHYITALREPMEALFPGDSLRHALARIRPGDDDVVTLLTNATDLDLYWSNIDAYFREHEDVPGADREGVVDRVKSLQRLLRVAPRADHVFILQEIGINSAYSIARASKRHFEQIFIETAHRLEARLDSAYRVTNSPEEMVLAGDSLKATATRIMSNAEHIAANNTELRLELSNLIRTDDVPGAIGGPSDHQKAIGKTFFRDNPEWQTLFGSVDFCACEDCRSVYSPAAYFVDLLHWLEKPEENLKGKLDAAEGPIRALLDRRPDLADIQLTCENTNTVLPYIDLVNEALESFLFTHLKILPNIDPNEPALMEWSDGPVAEKKLQARNSGAATAEQLRAVPQYIIPEVYDFLTTQAVYPMSLPNNHWLAVIRAYLAHLGVSRAEVIEVFGQSQDADKLAQKLVSERLGISLVQYRIVTGNPQQDLPATVRAYYGYDTLTSDNSLVAEIEKTPVGEFLKRTALTIADLEELLRTRFINQGGTIQLSNPKGDCDLSQTFLKGLSIMALDKLHRFLRLWRALDWSIADLDRAIFTLGGKLDVPLLERVQASNYLSQDLKQPIENLLPLWGNLDTHGEGSLYARAAADLFELDSSGANLADPNKKLAEHLTPVFAALRLSSTDFEAIKELNPELDQDAKLDMDNLSMLYRHGLLAQALRIRVKDLVTLIRLAPAAQEPFQDKNPTATAEFVQLVRIVQEINFIPLLNYLFRHVEEPTRHPAPTRALIETTLTTVADGLSQIHQETQPVEDSTGDTVRQQLSRLTPLISEPVDAENFIRPAELPETVDYLDLEKVKPADGEKFLQRLHKTLMQDLKSSFLNIDGDSQLAPDVIAWFKPVISPETEAERFQSNLVALRDRLLPWLRARLQRGLVIQTLAGALGVELPIMQRLLEDKDVFATEPDPDKGYAAIKDFLGLISADGTVKKIDPEKVQDAPVKTFVLLFKAAALLDGFAVAAPELVYVAKHRMDFDDFSLSNLPISPPDPSTEDGAAKKLFAGWLALAQFFSLLNSLPRSEKSMVEYLEDKEQNNELLAEVTGWDAASVQELKDKGFTATTSTDLTTMKRAVKMMKRVGASAAEIVSWATDAPTHTQAESVVQTVKAHYGQEQWLEVAQRLNDPLREERRDVLLDFLVARMTKPHLQLKNTVPNFPPGDREAAIELQRKLNFALEYVSSSFKPLDVDGKFGPKTEAAVKTFQATYGLPGTGIADYATWAMLDRAVGDVFDRNNLLEYFLIDVEMSSCMLTSRIKQANSAVQLFVQRCLLNLEAEVSPEAIADEQWEWMKNYRVWEANRKIFLYPENWIEPELRDDKTPFFKDLETELLQNELTDETVETALISYLYKLDEVARLDIRGFCREEKVVDSEEKEVDSEQKEIYHVFGRTWNPPYVYYYRRGIFPKNGPLADEWTAWERVDLDIQGDHLVPVVHNGRLYLLWPVFDQKPVKPDDSPTLKLQARLSYAERTEGKWLKKGVSKDLVRSFLINEESYPGVFGSKLSPEAKYFLAIVENSESLILEMASQTSTDRATFYVDGARHGRFLLDGCNGQIRAKEGPTGPTYLPCPRDYDIESQQLVETNGLAIVAFGLANILVNQPHGFYVIVSAVYTKMYDSYPFFLQDGPGGSQTYFARPVEETFQSAQHKVAGAFKEAKINPVSRQKTFDDDPVIVLAVSKSVNEIGR